MTTAELLAKYPFDPRVRPQDFPLGSPERLRGIPDEGYRKCLASLYLACEKRWAREETKRRADELRRQHQPLQAQSREHLENVWPYGDKP
jgi:hypothetical protein